MIRFDVFGRIIGVTREEGEWRAVYVGEDGKHRTASDVAIPPWLQESELRRFLVEDVPINRPAAQNLESLTVEATDLRNKSRLSQIVKSS